MKSTRLALLCCLLASTLALPRAQADIQLPGFPDFELPDFPELPGLPGLGDLLCGLDCFGSAGEASAQCHEDGGSFWDCLKAYRDAVKACRQEAGCESPGIPDLPDLPGLPDLGLPCGLKCFRSAAESVVDCLVGDGSREECLATYLDELAACREAEGCEDPDLPRLPDRPIFCGFDCIESAKDAIGQCREGGGSLGDCVRAFHAEFKACREAACGEAGDPDAEPDPEVVVEALVASMTAFARGDVNSDREIDIADPVGLLFHLFLGAAEPICMDAADANDDGGVDVSDPAAILGSLFLGSGALSPPGAALGIDPTPDGLDCAGY